MLLLLRSVSGGLQGNFQHCKTIGPKGSILGNLHVACVKNFLLSGPLVLSDSQPGTIYVSLLPGKEKALG